VSGKSNRNRKDKPSNWSARDRSGLLTPAARRALAGNVQLIVRNHEQFRGPALTKLAPTLMRLVGADIDTTPDNEVIRLWDLVYAVIEENAEAFARLTPPGSHDDCAMDMQNGLNTFGLPDEMAWQTPILERGGTILLPCPACTEDGNPHVLEVRQVDGQFLAFAVDRAEQ
jgi:hypothetical protein